MVLAFAWVSQVERGAKEAAVCSRPPSEVGVGMMVCFCVVVVGDEREVWRGRK